MLDRYVYGDVQRVSPEAPIPVLRTERETVALGGAGNVARNIAALGARAILSGLVGMDAAADDVRSIAEHNVSIDLWLVSDLARVTTVKTRFISHGQQLLRTDTERCDSPTTAIENQLLEQVAAGLAEADALVLSDYGKGVLSDGVIAKALKLAHEAGKVVITDPKSKDFARYRGTTVLTPNQHEVSAATELPCLDDAGAAAAGRRALEVSAAKAVLITRGAHGMSLISADGGQLHLPTEAREVYDVAGAGDTVVAAFATEIASGKPLADAASFANLAAGIVVGRVGTAVVSRADIEHALHSRAFAGIDDKLFSHERAMEQVRDWRHRHYTIGFTNGCFDLLHPGHLALLREARAACDRLVVALNTDVCVKRLKGARRPLQDQVTRATVLASMSTVDLVVLFEEDTPYRLIEALRPDLLVKGADYQRSDVVGADLVESYGGKVMLVDLVADYSTTHTLERLRRDPAEQATPTSAAGVHSK